MLPQLLDLLFPRRSLQGEEGEFVSAKELQSMQGAPVTNSTLALRSCGLQYLDCIRAGASYQTVPLLRKAICAYKYKHMPELTEALVLPLLQSIPNDYKCAEALLCPVPLHWLRKNQRGFNQAELLAKAIARKRGMPLELLLQRKRSTGHQAWRNRSERLSAMQNAFDYVGKGAVPSTVILIDDVATTGATLDACSKVLKEFGVKRVEGWVMARG